MNILHGVNRFFKRNYLYNNPLLLALSGGPDSIALFHLMVEIGIPFAVAHVDHRWRKESVDEANQLKTLCRHSQISFHLKVLNATNPSGNLEEFCRNERRQFFNHLCRENGYNAVVLGHHRDDQSETVLKRLLEGAPLISCGGMAETSHIEGVVYWRPLLEYTKFQVIQWLKENKISYFWDHTNADQKFLRARMREKMLPELGKVFGKEISGNLVSIGREVQELEKFMHDKMGGWLSQIEVGPLGTFLDLSEQCPQTPFEVEYLVRSMLKSPTRTIIQQAANHLLKSSSDKSFSVGKQTLIVDRKMLFVYDHPSIVLPEERKKIDADFTFGPWLVSMQEEALDFNSSSWRQVLKGELHVTLPTTSTPYYLGKVCTTINYPGTSSIRRFWGAQKVPSFIRYWVPVVWNKESIAHEFLTGRVVNESIDKHSSQTIVLKFR